MKTKKKSKRSRRKSVLPKVVISVPHSNPIGDGDRYSLHHACNLKRKFRESKRLFIHKKIRRRGISDANRVFTPWKSLMRMYEKIAEKGSPSIAIDVHSFDEVPPRWNVPKDSTLVIVAEGSNYQLLQTMQCPFPVIKGSHENRNIVRARIHNIPALLLEFKGVPLDSPELYTQISQFCKRYHQVYLKKYGRPFINTTDIKL